MFLRLSNCASVGGKTLIILSKLLRDLFYERVHYEGGGDCPRNITAGWFRLFFSPPEERSERQTQSPVVKESDAFPLVFPVASAGILFLVYFSFICCFTGCKDDGKTKNPNFQLFIFVSLKFFLIFLASPEVFCIGWISHITPYYSSVYESVSGYCISVLYVDLKPANSATDSLLLLLWTFRGEYHFICDSPFLHFTPVVLILINPLNPELNPICYLLTLLAHHFLHVSRIRVKSLTIRLLMSYIYGAPILDVSRSHTTTHHSR